MSFKLSSYCPMLYAHEDKVHVHAIQLSTCLFIPKTMVQWRRVKHMLPQQIRNGGYVRTMCLHNDDNMSDYYSQKLQCNKVVSHCASPIREKTEYCW